MLQPSGDFGLNSVDALAASIQALPWAAHWVAVVASIAGLLLWGVGRQVLPPLFCLIGGVGGGIAGFFAAAAFGVDQVGTVPAPLVGLGVGGFLGMALAAALYRFAIAVGFGLVAGLSGILVSATVLELQPQARTAFDSAIAAHRESLGVAGAEHASIFAPGHAVVGHAGGVGSGAAATLTSQARGLAVGLGNEFAGRWQTLEPRSQFIVAASGLGAAGLGFLIGLLLPSRSAAAATALFGSAVWLAGGVWLAGALNVPGREYLDRGPREWLIIWLCAAGVGLALQFQGMASARKSD